MQQANAYKDEQRRMVRRAVIHKMNAIEAVNVHLHTPLVKVARVLLGDFLIQQ